MALLSCKCVRVFGALSLAAALSGCAAKAPSSQHPQWRVAGPTQHMNRDYVAPLPRSRVIIEDDGLEEQAPPLVRKGKPVQDDPTEPFSPNYGSVPVRQGAVRPNVDVTPLDVVPEYDIGRGPVGARHAVPIAVRAADVVEEPPMLPANLPFNVPAGAERNLLDDLAPESVGKRREAQVSLPDDLPEDFKTALLRQFR